MQFDSENVDADGRDSCSVWWSDLEDIRILLRSRSGSGIILLMAILKRGEGVGDALVVVMLLGLRELEVTTGRNE